MLPADKPSPQRAPTGGAAACQPRPAAPGYLRLGPILALPQLLRERGIDPAPVLLTAGLVAADFDDPEHPIPFVAMGALLLECAERTGCAHFGLLTGARAGVESLGVVGALGRAAPDVGAALRSLILYFHLHDQGGVPSLAVAGEAARIGYAVYQPGTPGVGQVCDAAMAIGVNILRSFCGAGWAPTAVLLPHARPADVRPYRTAFGVLPQFDAEQAAIDFDAACLRRRLPGSNARTFALLEAETLALNAQGRGEPVQQLRRVVRSLISTNAGHGLRQVADLLAVHRRTLNRRLAGEGTSFRTPVDEVRFECARQLLEETGLSVTAVAAALEYADASAFSRAFKRRAGVAPAAWRAGRLDEPAQPRWAP